MKLSKHLLVIFSTAEELNLKRVGLFYLGASQNVILFYLWRIRYPNKGPTGILNKWPHTLYSLLMLYLRTKQWLSLDEIHRFVPFLWMTMKLLSVALLNYRPTALKVLSLTKLWHCAADIKGYEVVEKMLIYRDTNAWSDISETVHMRSLAGKKKARMKQLRTEYMA